MTTLLLKRLSTYYPTEILEKTFAAQIEDNKPCIYTRVDEYKEKDSYLT